MLFVKVPKEIKDYEEKLIAGLSTRQICWGLLAVITSLMTFFILKIFVSSGFASYVTMFVGIPLFACGFRDYQEMHMSKFLKIALNYYRKKQILTYDNNYPRKETGIYEKTLTKKQRKIAHKERKKLIESQEN